jgi:hypothetical protein
VAAVSTPARRTVLAALVGIVFVGFAVLVLLSAPMALFFTEGVPRDFPGGPTAYALAYGAGGLAALIAGVGILRSREWGRIGGLVLLLVLAALSWPSPVIMISLAMVLIHVLRWRSA